LKSREHRFRPSTKHPRALLYPSKPMQRRNGPFQNWGVSRICQPPDARLVDEARILSNGLPSRSSIADLSSPLGHGRVSQSTFARGVRLLMSRRRGGARGGMERDSVVLVNAAVRGLPRTIPVPRRLIRAPRVGTNGPSPGRSYTGRLRWPLSVARTEHQRRDHAHPRGSDLAP